MGINYTMPSWFEGGTYPESILISLLRNTWGILEKYYEVVLLRNRYKIIQLFFWEYFLLYLFNVYIKGAVSNSIYYEFYFVYFKNVTQIYNFTYSHHKNHKYELLLSLNMETIISLFLMLINLEFIHCHAMSFNLKLNNGCAKKVTLINKMKDINFTVGCFSIISSFKTNDTLLRVSK